MRRDGMQLRWVVLIALLVAGCGATPSPPTSIPEPPSGFPHIIAIMGAEHLAGRLPDH
ncbi:MAG TPA: hypothetical protein VGQ64_04095 [Candidatus Limnocylindrales bacterium]|nr:hypothetical protein [Candidatus Limnocylindrales bacterium]